MHAKSHIGMRAGPLLTNIGYSVADTGYWRIAIIIIAAAFLIMLLAAQSGEGAKLERGAELAFARARQLLHEADTENRKVRPLPLSLAKVLYLPAEESSYRSIGSESFGIEKRDIGNSQSQGPLRPAVAGPAAPAVDRLLCL